QAKVALNGTQPTSTGAQPVGGAISTKPSGSMISASISTPSMTRGPGREKYDDPSSAKTWPDRAARSSLMGGGTWVLDHSSMVSARWKPHGMRKSMSGSTSATSAHVVGGAFCPSDPSTSPPPAPPISSGTPTPTP